MCVELALCCRFYTSRDALPQVPHAPRFRHRTRRRRLLVARQLGGLLPERRDVVAAQDWSRASEPRRRRQTPWRRRQMRWQSGAAAGAVACRAAALAAEAAERDAGVVVVAAAARRTAGVPRTARVVQAAAVGRVGGAIRELSQKLAAATAMAEALAPVQRAVRGDHPPRAAATGSSPRALLFAPRERAGAAPPPPWLLHAHAARLTRTRARWMPSSTSGRMPQGRMREYA